MSVTKKETGIEKVSPEISDEVKIKTRDSVKIILEKKYFFTDKDFESYLIETLLKESILYIAKSGVESSLNLDDDFHAYLVASCLGYLYGLADQLDRLEEEFRLKKQRGIILY